MTLSSPNASLTSYGIITIATAFMKTSWLGSAFMNVSLIFLFFFFFKLKFFFTFLEYFCLCFPYTDGVPVWEEENPGGDAKAEPEGAQPGHERSGPRANEAGAAGEEDHRWYKEDGQTGTNGELKGRCTSSSYRWLAAQILGNNYFFAYPLLAAKLKTPTICLPIN